ncbi:MAG: hypothetical protein IKQ63_04400 [Eubacterium sp.]|nr:hypothetical protein [Eubacterium sp.]
MPEINRIRVNNVKYNFGTQYYDDFSMRMYGRNTIYDLANGGGKSVLMLLLMQNLIPNCTLDDKQPVEKLFRDGCGNTTIHSLIEWKLDECDLAEGFRYMTTGFCARKAKDSSETAGQMKLEEAAAEEKSVSGGESGTAAIEYFNYVIFYNSYNKNDIINLPLIRDKEHISYQALKNYLLDLSHKNVELKVMVFDKKGEYQRFISNYGLHESQWEIIRGINKTEGHVRTYFENNYKTTRKVIEDLLIEEIIDKAFLVRTERDEGSKNGMARLLISIRDQLKNLAEKKRDIASYDHQIELIELLHDRVRSFEDIYREKDEVEKLLSDIYVTVEKAAAESEREREGLIKAMDDASALKQEMTAKLDEISVSMEMNTLDEKRALAESLKANVEEASRNLEEARERLIEAESGNEYLDYILDGDRKKEVDEKLRLLESGNKEIEDIHDIVYSIRLLLDKRIEQYEREISESKEKLQKYEKELELSKKTLAEAEANAAELGGAEKSALLNCSALEERIASAFNNLNDKSFDDINAKLAGAKLRRDNLSKEEKETALEKDSLAAELTSLHSSIESNSAKMAAVSSERARVEKLRDSFEGDRSRLEKLRKIYLGDETGDLSELGTVIDTKIGEATVSLRDKEQLLRTMTKRYNDILAGRLIEPTEGVEKVLSYLRSRHNIYAMTGMDYLAALPEDKRSSIISSKPELPYGVVCSDFDKIVNDQNIEDVDTGNELVPVFNEEELDSESYLRFGARNDAARLLHRGSEFFVDERSGEKLASEKKAEIDVVNDEIRSLRDFLMVTKEDREFVIGTLSPEKLSAREDADNLSSQENALLLEKNELLGRVGRLGEKLSETEGKLTVIRGELAEVESDISILTEASTLSALAEADRKRAQEAGAEKKRISLLLDGLYAENRKLSDLVQNERNRISSLTAGREKLSEEWNGKYAAYHTEGSHKVVGDDLSSLSAAFDMCLRENVDQLKEQESLRMLSDTLKNSMERILKNIEARKAGLTEQLEETRRSGKLVRFDKDALRSLRDRLGEESAALQKIEAKRAEQRSECDRLSGSIEYAIKNINDAFGAFSRIEDTSENLELMKKNAEVRLAEAKENYEKNRKSLTEFDRRRRDSEDIYKDIKRLIERNGIDISNASVISGEEVRSESFEQCLVRYDSIQKAMERAKLELVRSKGRIAETLTGMSAFGLANTIKEDVQIPGSLADSEVLVQSLKEMTEVIRIEKERIGKSLSDMELLHDSFVDQCLDRCLDVKTELELLPGLSGIVLDGEKIDMIKLSIPYIKEEYMRERMASYIDRIVEEADKINDDDGRVKFIRASLSTKKLFGVIVTDMNKIKLSLYKRERIKEQSRYLKYEEAVGSTGQSQGIYIQFLISVINYISGMYAPDSIGTRSKTIFIDNPFGAAKDIYIWEPIFKLLEANSVQLIVPARGASPAITGRFDINYILGQQIRGGREVTVVVNYESRTSQEELEYHELTYEQQTFDFI